MPSPLGALHHGQNALRKGRAQVRKPGPLACPSLRQGERPWLVAMPCCPSKAEDDNLPWVPDPVSLPFRPSQAPFHQNGPDRPQPRHRGGNTSNHLLRSPSIPRVVVTRIAFAALLALTLTSPAVLAQARSGAGALWTRTRQTAPLPRTRGAKAATHTRSLEIEPLSPSGDIAAEYSGQPGGNLTFCSAVLQFDVRWALVNLDFPGVPFFNDGNNDGIADELQLPNQRSKLQTLATDIKALASDTASFQLRTELSRMAVDTQRLGGEDAPVSSRQSKQEVAPIERIASKVQGQISALDCLATLKPRPAKSATSGTAAQLILLGALILCLVTFRLVYRRIRPMYVDSSGDRFGGYLRKTWVATWTGVVIDSHFGTQTVTTTQTTTSVGPYGSTPTGSSTSVHHNYRDHFRLRTANGDVHDITLWNYHVDPSIGDHLTIAYANKNRTLLVFGPRSVVLAVINLTANKQYTNKRDLRRVGMRHANWVALWLLITLPLTLVMLIPYVIADAIQMRRFQRRGIVPLWERSRQEAAQLSQPLGSQASPEA